LTKQSFHHIGINRREVEAAIADTVFDNESDQQKAAKNLKTYTLAFDSTQDFEKQLEQHIENMRRMGKSLFTDCEEMSNKHAISVAMRKP
jgi:glutamine synthetase adenylyltransferase